MPRTSKDIARDVAMVGSPDDWPNWPALPLKREDDMRLGVVLAYDFCYAEGRIVVWETNLYMVPTRKHPSGVSVIDRDGLEALPHHVYQDGAALVADGWKVD